MEGDAERRKRRIAPSGAVRRSRPRSGRTSHRFLAERPGAEEALRRTLTLKLATVREDGEPTRRREVRTEFLYDEWQRVTELAGYPNRLLVTATTTAGETYSEVAHEAIFKRWDKLKGWVVAEREFLSWHSRPAVRGRRRLRKRRAARC